VPSRRATVASWGQWSAMWICPAVPGLVWTAEMHSLGVRNYFFGITRGESISLRTSATVKAMGHCASVFRLWRRRLSARASLTSSPNLAVDEESERSSDTELRRKCLLAVVERRLRTPSFSTAGGIFRGHAKRQSAIGTW